MSRLPLSNLQVRPNLVAEEDCQQHMLRCTISELRDIERRNPGLVHLSPARRKEVQAALFWGDSPPPLDPNWAEPLAAGMADALQALEEHPTLEAAFECLVLARGFYHSRPAGPTRVAAAEWDRRVCAVLTRDEFRYTRDMTDQRLNSILGRELANPTPPAPAQPPALPSRLPTVVKPKLVPASSVLTAPATPLAPKVEAAAPPAATAPRPVLVVSDPDLKRLVQRWATLPNHVKKCVVMLLDAAEVTGTTPTP